MTEVQVRICARNPFCIRPPGHGGKCVVEEHLMDILDPEAPTIDDRLQWTPVYMGEGHSFRCGNCSMTRAVHEATADALYCYETYLRIQDGNR